MDVLGYPRFGAAGGDLGSHVSRYLALDHPDRVVAVHRTDAGLPAAGVDPAELEPEERDWLREVAAWGATEGAYAAMHRTKPQTAAVGLTDSPAGLAAWIVEKLHGWSDCGGDLERSFTKDEILTNVTLYWLTGTIGSSMRMYRANAAIPPAQLMRRVEVPSGFSLFAGDVVRPPRRWLERTTNAVRVTEPPRGGHFAPFEEPELYAEELRTFFRPFRSSVDARYRRVTRSHEPTCAVPHPRIVDRMSSFIGYLRDRSDDELVALLRSRPDLASPSPATLSSLAVRATSRSSLETGARRAPTRASCRCSRP